MARPVDTAYGVAVGEPQLGHARAVVPGEDPDADRSAGEPVRGADGPRGHRLGENPPAAEEPSADRVLGGVRRAGLDVPEYLEFSVRHGGRERVAWLASLPRLVAELSEAWGLTLGRPFEPGGNCAWVAPGTDRAGRDVVLKLGWTHEESRDEAVGLALLSGEGSAELYASAQPTADTTALVLERILPGTMLRTRPESEQHEVVCGLARRIRKIALPADHGLRPLSEMVAGWLARDFGEEVNRRDLDTGLVRAARSTFAELAHDPVPPVLLMTDLHAGNILAAQRRPWLLIDPKPYVGDPAYDLTQHLLNCMDSLRADPLGLVRRVADLAEVEADRLRRWTFARTVGHHVAGLEPDPGAETIRALAS